jgi:hypothetical protein
VGFISLEQTSFLNVYFVEELGSINFIAFIYTRLSSIQNLVEEAGKLKVVVNFLMTLSYSSHRPLRDI